MASTNYCNSNMNYSDWNYHKKIINSLSYKNSGAFHSSYGEINAYNQPNPKIFSENYKTNN